jgi:hypothetical protein
MNQALMDRVLSLWQHRRMENLHTPPVEIVLAAFGGVRKLAKVIDRDPAAVCRWRKSGMVPNNMQRKVLEVAWERGIAITAHEMIFGRKV